MKKIEVSKKLLIANYIAAFSLSAATVIGCFLGKDMSCLATVSSCAWVEAGVSNAFYYWKAKNENRSIHAMALLKELIKTYGEKFEADALARLIETVLKE